MPRVLQGDVRSRILDAAKERLWHYGLKKTTIDEIAADAGVGKGTVYLYFDSKEDIALAIIAQYKKATLEEARVTVADPALGPAEKLKAILSTPLMEAHRRCTESPAAQELVLAVRPHVQAHMRPYMEEEIALLAEVLAEGNLRGDFAIEDTMAAARTLKHMTMGMMPPYPCVSSQEEITAEVGRMVDLVARGLRKA